MAKFEFEVVKVGPTHKINEEFISISNVIIEPDDEVIVFPDTYQGKPITHLGYYQEFEEEHEEWCDWHHPAKGSTYVPDTYKRGYFYLKSDILNVKSFVIPASIKDISFSIFRYVKNVNFIVDENNQEYSVHNNKICYKGTTKSAL